MTEGIVKAGLRRSKDLPLERKCKKMFYPAGKRQQGEKVTTGKGIYRQVRVFRILRRGKRSIGTTFDYAKLDGGKFCPYKNAM
jgi:hypothetical protein